MLFMSECYFQCTQGCVIHSVCLVRTNSGQVYIKMFSTENALNVNQASLWCYTLPVTSVKPLVEFVICYLLFVVCY